ncbi:hypothetical protein ACROYT_G002750 [Oculina patagonica]
MSLPFKILYRESGRVWPADEVPQDRRTSQPVQDNMELNMVRSEEANVCQTDLSEESEESQSTSKLDNGENSRRCRSDEHGEDEDGFQGIDLGSSITSRTLVDLMLSVCKSSTTSSLGRSYFPSAVDTDAAAAEGVTGNENPIGAELNLSTSTTQSLQQIHHVTEVVTVDVEVPIVESVARTGYESEQASSVSTEEEGAEFSLDKEFVIKVDSTESFEYESFGVLVVREVCRPRLIVFAAM